MPIYFCDSLKDVSILNGVARLEFQRLEAVPAGDSREVRMVAEFTVAIPIQGLAQTLSLLEGVRDRLVREGIFNEPAPAETPEPQTAAPRGRPAARFPNFWALRVDSISRAAEPCGNDLGSCLIRRRTALMSLRRRPRKEPPKCAACGPMPKPRRLVDSYDEKGVGRDVALRVYTSRLLGGDPQAGAAWRRQHVGQDRRKGPPRRRRGSAVRQGQRLGHGGDRARRAAGRAAGAAAQIAWPREHCPDEEMVRVQRANLIDPGAPNPSVETLLHAFLPHKFVDHTHSTAVLSLADQPDAALRCAELYGGRLGLVPYIMPGFQLAKKAAEVFDADPAVEGLVLLKHGIFTFGDTAEEAYERMIAAVSQAEERLSRRRNTTVFPAARLAAAIAGPAEVAPILRGACAIPSPVDAGAYKRFILEFRTSRAILDYVDGAELGRYSQAGVATPDHTLRTKNHPLIVPAPETGRLDDFTAAVRGAVDRFVADYHVYFARHNPRQATPKRELDPMPRVILVPGLGLFGLGGSARDAQIAADIAEIDSRDRDRRRGRRRISTRSAKPICSTSNTGRSNRQSSAKSPTSRSPGRSRP